MKKLIFTTILNTIILSCSTNIQIIKDEFGNIDYYKSDYVEVKHIDSSIKLQFKSTANNIIILEMEYSDNNSYDIIKENKVSIYFEDDTSIKLQYIPESATIDLITRTTTGVDFNPYNTTRYSAPITTYSTKYIIKAQGQLKIFNKSIKKIEVERKEGIKEYKISKLKSDKLLTLYKELQSKLTTNIKE